jgi:hypothetical protein
MRRNFVLLVSLFAPAVALNAGDIGFAVNGTCKAGNCPATPIPFNSTETLPFDVSVTLEDGDTYLINGSFTGTDNSNGAGSGSYAFQVTYEGNGSGRPSAADTITVTRDEELQASLSSQAFFTTMIGAFGPGIAASSSVSSCLDGTIGCLGPLGPPSSFNRDSNAFVLSKTNGAFDLNKDFVSSFGAGSAVGSYVVWGQTTPIAPPNTIPEPNVLGQFALGLSGVIVGVVRRVRKS